MTERYTLIPRIGPLKMTSERVGDAIKATVSADILGYDVARVVDVTGATRVWWDDEAGKMRTEPIDPRDLYP